MIYFLLNFKNISPEIELSVLRAKFNISIKWLFFMDYKRYKWFYTKSGKLVVGGKSAEQNDSLLTELKATKKDMIVMHTKSPGSPFCVIIAPIDAVSEKDIEECAIFTGCFSRAWKERHKNATVDVFRLSQLFKSGLMKTGYDDI